MAVVVEGAENLCSGRTYRFKKEIDRIKKKRSILKWSWTQVNKKLSNRVVFGAPAAVVEGEKDKLKKYTDMYEKIIESWKR